MTDTLYRTDLRAHPALTRQEQAHALAQLVRGRQAARLLRAGRDTPEIRQAVLDGADARDRLIVGNIKLVATIAASYAGRGVEEDDLIQEGCTGLIRAIAKYRPEALTRGTFANYASWWIKEAIRDAVADHARAIRVPRGLYWRMRRMLRAAATLEATTGVTPTRRQLADALGIPEYRVAVLQGIAAPLASLDVPVSDAPDSASLADLVPAEQPAVAQVVEDRQCYARLALVFNALPDREREVIARRFGLLTGKPQRLREIGTVFGRTREAIRLAEGRALVRMNLGMAAYA